MGVRHDRLGPNNEKHWAKVDFSKINYPKGFEATDYFNFYKSCNAKSRHLEKLT